MSAGVPWMVLLKLVKWLTPLLVLNLLYRIIPGVPCVVDEDVDLAAAKLRRLFN